MKVEGYRRKPDTGKQVRERMDERWRGESGGKERNRGEKEGGMEGELR